MDCDPMPAPDRYPVRGGDRIPVVEVLGGRARRPYPMNHNKGMPYIFPIRPYGDTRGFVH